ncbi:hypothetical protein FHS54_002899 [Sphingobium vermicomposti]|uniref:Uncharacterized protein n=1 Tax=Sphingobium vermicomposti TaxID=529005 RepID=A0A846M7S0_9SPHN|nr:hypothetical protein [Sphingobium vermicomposti]
MKAFPRKINADMMASKRLAAGGEKRSDILTLAGKIE